MPHKRPAIERRILSALDAAPSRIPVILGGCGSGRTALLQRISHLIGTGNSQYIDAERVTSTPEGLLAAITADSPYASGADPSIFDSERRTARDSFEALVSFFCNNTRSTHNTPTFLIDEVLEFKTLESFPGLRGALREFLAALGQSPNRFAISSRYINRSLHLLRDLPERFEVIQISPLDPSETIDTLRDLGVGRNEDERSDIGRMVHALTNGRPVYVSALAAALSATKGASAGDPVSALASQLSTRSPLYSTCRFCYELRLHRARGYGALKAILAILADEEPLTLTQIAQRLRRTPGSTKDYLSWLEDVDVISVRQKRYSYTDPIMRLWVRLHGRPTPPTDIEIAPEVQEFAVQRLPYMESAPQVPASTGTKMQPTLDRTSWEMLEID